MDKLKDDLDAVRVLIETLEPFEKDDRERIIRWAAEKLGMSTIASISTTFRTTQLVKPQDSSSQLVSSPTTNLKSFIDEKNPKTAVHFTAAVAYYYLYEAPPDNRKESVNRDTLAESVRIVKWGRGLQNPSQTLINTFNAGLLDKASERGEYKLNMVGKNLVAVLLPDDGTSPQVKKSARHAKKKKAVTSRSKTKSKAKKTKAKTTKKTHRKK
jgi:hypothetical protein